MDSPRPPSTTPSARARCGRPPRRTWSIASPSRTRRRRSCRARTTMAEERRPMDNQKEMQSLVDGIDPEILRTVVTRREAIAKGASVSAGIAAMLALGSVPIAIGALSKEAYGQTPSDVLDVLQFALLLEQLEADFYSRGIAAVGLIPLTDLPIFQAISAHETAHVNALKNLITSKGGTPGTAPTFDYTAKGNVPGFNFGPTQYGTFQVLAHAFE